MSRFGDYDGEEWYPNQAQLWQANARRALTGKRGRKALAEMREALLALPEKKLICGALCTVGGMDRKEVAEGNKWFKFDFQEKLEEEGEGVCAVGAYVWYKKVKAGADPREAFESIPVALDVDGGSWDTAMAGKEAGLTYTLASSLAYKNDETFYSMSAEERYTAFIAWIDEQLAA